MDEKKVQIAKSLYADGKTTVSEICETPGVQVVERHCPKVGVDLGASKAGGPSSSISPTGTQPTPSSGA